MARDSARKTQGGAGVWLALATAAAPGVILIAALAARFGVIDPDTALDVGVFRIGRFFALAGVAAAALAVVLAFRGARRWAPALASVVVALATVGALTWQQARLGPDAAVEAHDVSTDRADPPGFGRLVADARRVDGAIPLARAGEVEGCPGLAAIDRLVSEEEAFAALRGAGFRVAGAAPYRVEGSREGFWFGLTHDAVIRMRPGQTDIRVSARSGRAQGGEACRLAEAVMAPLRTPR